MRQRKEVRPATAETVNGPEADRLAKKIERKRSGTRVRFQRKRVIGTADLEWRASGTGFGLHLCRSKKTLLTIKPDERHPTMWRINRRGQVSDMASHRR